MYFKSENCTPFGIQLDKSKITGHILVCLKLVVNATAFLETANAFKDSVQRNGLTLGLATDVIAVTNID